MAADYNELLARTAERETEIMTAISITADAKPYFFHEQEAFPYFTNRIGNDDISAVSEELDDHTLQVIARLVVAHATEGYRGEPESKLYTYIPEIIVRFNQNPFLITATYTAAMDDLFEARITNHTGLRAFQNAGISAIQVGCEFTITCSLNERITLEYT